MLFVLPNRQFKSIEGVMKPIICGIYRGCECRTLSVYNSPLGLLWYGHSIHNLCSSLTLSKIRVCFSSDTVPCHVISAILKISQQCVFFVIIVIFLPLGE